ncbi:MAG: hypothetical protein ABSC05_39755, partial [Candidatus Solibacter sp.]
GEQHAEIDDAAQHVPDGATFGQRRLAPGGTRRLRQMQTFSVAISILFAMAGPVLTRRRTT